MVSGIRCAAAVHCARGSGTLVADRGEVSLNALEEQVHAGHLLTGSPYVFDCRTCGFAHLWPIPADLDNYYRSEYFSETKPKFEVEHEEDSDWWEAVYSDRLEAVKAVTSGCRLLDVGAGYGHFCEFAAGRGWSTTAIEPSGQGKEACRNRAHRVVESIPAQEFDCIVLSEVLEHLADPAAMLRECRLHLNREGCLFVQVPNDFNRLQMRLADSHGYYWVVAPDHVNYFNLSSLRGLLDSCGLRVVDCYTSFPMEIFLMMGLDYTKDAALGRRVHGMRKAFDLSLTSPERLELYRDLAQRGIGRDISWLVVAG